MVKEISIANVILCKRKVMPMSLNSLNFSTLNFGTPQLSNFPTPLTFQL